MVLQLEIDRIHKKHPVRVTSLFYVFQAAQYVCRGSTEERRFDERDAERAEAERLRDEGKQVVSIGGGDGGKTIEHEVIPRLVDQDPWAQLRRPMDMIRQG